MNFKKILPGVLIFAFVFAFVGAEKVFAHAHLVESSPKKDEVLKALPAGLHAQFSEELEISMSKLEVKNIQTHEEITEGKTQGDLGNPKAMFIALKPQEKKADYEVQWKAVAKDTHVMKGSFRFTVDPTKK